MHLWDLKWFFFLAHIAMHTLQIIEMFQFYVWMQKSVEIWKSKEIIYILLSV
jgi:hypothetical protein